MADWIVSADYKSFENLYQFLLDDSNLRYHHNTAELYELWVSVDISHAVKDRLNEFLGAKPYVKFQEKPNALALALQSKFAFHSVGRA